MSRRFLRFSVRQLLVLVSVLSVLLAIVVWRTQSERQLQNRYRRLRRAQADLEEAVRDDDVTLARQALDADANPNGLLGTCIDNGQLAMVELLLESGEDVEQMMELSGSLYPDGPPLFRAICCYQPTEVRLKMIRVLVKHGADPRREVGCNPMDLAVHRVEPDVADLLRELGLPYGPREMAAFNRLEELRPAVEQNPAMLRERLRPIYAGQGPTLLGIALARGYRQMTLFLVEQGAPLDIQEGRGLTLLHLAARGGNPELIHLLVARGLDVNAQDKIGDTPLTDCVWTAPPEAISALIQAGADVNACRGDGKTALHLAILNERVEVTRILLAAAADPLIPDGNGQTAADLGRVKNGEIARLLAEARRGREPHDSK